MKIRTACVLVTVLALAGTAFAQQVFVYPQKGQSQQQQDIDTAECTRWAKQQSGVDPNAPKQPDQVGSHARGAAGGAAKGAAVGAAVGGVAGRRGSKQAKQAAEAETTNTYQRAFAACMEGRGYSVK
jgi:hypothetical protein